MGMDGFIKNRNNAPEYSTLRPLRGWIGRVMGALRG